MPASSAAWMMRIESSWSALPQAPNIIVPRQSFETWTPVRPSGRYSMTCSSRSVWRLAIAGARPVKADVMRRPAQAERLAPGRQLADQGLEAAVVRVASGLRAQRRDQLGGPPLPVGVELARRRV